MQNPFKFLLLIAILFFSQNANAQIIEDDASLAEWFEGFYFLEARLQQAKKSGGLVAFSIEDQGQGDYLVSYQGIAQLIAGFDVPEGQIFDTEYVLNNAPLAINDNSVNNTIVHLDIGEGFFFGYWDDTHETASNNGRPDPMDGFGWAEIRRDVSGLELIASASANFLGIVTGQPQLAPQPFLGDINEDTLINLLDVGPFVDVIASGIYQGEADVDQDGLVNLQDVQPFIGVLTGG